MGITVAIVGLGRVGSILLQEMLKCKEKGINIVAVAEIDETPGKILARDKKIGIKSMEEISAMGDKVDLIFECTGKNDIRKNLQQHGDSAIGFHGELAHIAVLHGPTCFLREDFCHAG